MLSANAEIGFLLEGNDLRMDFLFSGKKRVNYAELGDRYRRQGKTVVADFPLPMHTGAGKLIELALVQGEVVNFLFSGGRRLDGMVIIRADGRAYPTHVQRIGAHLLEDSRDGLIWDLSHSAEDLRIFLETARKQKVSVVMEMLLLDFIDGQDVRVIAESREGGGRRMLVWKNDNQKNPVPNPSLLVVGEGHGHNELTWAAYQLGFNWGINCDVNYFDRAAYWVNERNGLHRIQFAGEEKSDKLPFHRMVLYTERMGSRRGERHP